MGAIIMKKTKSGKVKKVCLSIVSLGLVVGLTIVGTLAYLSTNTGQKTNVFTGSGGITADLTEPGWEEGKAQQYTPNMVLKKDPIVTNTTVQGKESDNDYQEYVALKVVYQVCKDGNWSTITQGDFKQFASITDVASPADYAAATWGFNSEWILDDDANADTNYAQIFYYKTPLTKSNYTDKTKNKTQPLFQNVVIKPEGNLTPNTVLDFTSATTNADATTPTITTVQITGLPQFRILIKGSAVLANASDFADLDAAKPALKDKLPTIADMTTAAN